MTLKCPACLGESTFALASCDNWLDYAQSQQGPRKSISDIVKENPQFRFDSFVRCNSCGFTFVSPAPLPNDLTLFYKSYYGNQSYIDKSHKKIKRAQKLIQRIKKYKPQGSFLDVGCNVGYMPEVARQAGFNATGIEIDPDAVETAKKNFPKSQFFCSDIESFSKTASPFDFIYCSEVIEHVPDVRSFVSMLAKLCNKGGYIYLTTPEARWRKSARRFIEWREVRPPEHIQWFTRKSISILLESAGFKVKKFIFNIKPGLKLFAERI